MGEGTEEIIYMMAAEKIVNLIFVLEQTIEFIEENKIGANEAAQEAMLPLLAKLTRWIED